MLELLQDKHHGALRQNEPIPVTVIRSRGESRFVVAGRKRSHLSECAHREWRDGRFRTTGNHHLGVTAGNCRRRLPQSVSRGRTGRRHRHVRSAHVEQKTHLACEQVGSDLNDEKRRNPAEALFLPRVVSRFNFG